VWLSSSTSDRVALPRYSTRIGPKRDIVGTWARIARAHGLRFGVSNHSAHAWHWFQTAYDYDPTGPEQGTRYDAYTLTKADGKGKWWDGLDPQELYTGRNIVMPDGIGRDPGVGPSFIAVLGPFAGDDAAYPALSVRAIGGEQSLRGFGDGRFQDANRFFASAELRLEVFREKLFGVLMSLEAAPFLDAGRVFPSARDLPLSALHLAGGLGFRAVIRPQLVAYVDLGYGSEGPAAFAERRDAVWKDDVVQEAGA